MRRCEYPSSVIVLTKTWSQDIHVHVQLHSLSNQNRWLTDLSIPAGWFPFEFTVSCPTFACRSKAVRLDKDNACHVHVCLSHGVILPGKVFIAILFHNSFLLFSFLFSSVLSSVFFFFRMVKMISRLYLRYILNTHIRYNTYPIQRNHPIIILFYCNGAFWRPVFYRILQYMYSYVSAETSYSSESGKTSHLVYHELYESSPVDSAFCNIK